MTTIDRFSWSAFVVVMAIGGSAANAATVTIYGNQHGLWSPTHPELTGLRAIPPSPPKTYVPPAVAQVEEPENEVVAEVMEPRPVVDTNAPNAPDVCFKPGDKPAFC